MSPLLGPILAQLVTLSVNDRTEVRYIVVDVPDGGTTKSTAVATAPRAGLNFGWKNATLGIGYGTSLTVVPVESKDRSVLVYHSGAIFLSNRWQRTTVTASETFGYGRIDFGVQALAGPGTVTVPGSTGTPTSPTPAPTTGAPPTGPTGGTPTGGGAQPQPGTTNSALLPGFGSAKLGTSVTALNVSQLMSAVLTLSATVNYSVTGAVGSDQRNADAFPTVRGPGGLIAAGYSPSFRDRVTTTLSTQFLSSSTGNNAWFLLANEVWTHRLGKQTATSLGSGLSLYRNSQPDGLISYSIYPNFNGGISNASRLGRNTLALGLNAGASPYIDPLRALVDPSLSASGFVGLSRQRFTSSLTASSAIALVSHGDNRAFNSFTSALSLGYVLGTGVSVDGGVRAAWQSFAGVTTVPPSFAAFAGITLGAALKLSDGR